MTPDDSVKQEAGLEERGTVWVSSFVDRTNHTVLARGRFTQLLRGYFDHAAGLGLLPEGETLPMMREALSTATLHLALLPPDQFSSWTYNMVEPSLNLFVTGDNREHQITGRVFTENVKTKDSNRLFVESQRPRYEPSQSIIDFEQPRVMDAFHLYYERSLQMRARFFELGRDELGLIQGLPNVDRGWFGDLTLDDARAIFDGPLEKIEMRTYRFFCGCDLDRIVKTVKELFGSDPEQLFDGDQEVEVQCPRCGRFWMVERDLLNF